MMKVYRNHRCTKQHRTYVAFVKCAFRRLSWVTGEGPFACISWCNGYIYPISKSASVTLWETLEEAEKAKQNIDVGACGGGCQKRHEIVRIDK